MTILGETHDQVSEEDYLKKKKESEGALESVFSLQHKPLLFLLDVFNAYAEHDNGETSLGLFEGEQGEYFKRYCAVFFMAGIKRDLGPFQQPNDDMYIDSFGEEELFMYGVENSVKQALDLYGRMLMANSLVSIMDKAPIIPKVYMELCETAFGPMIQAADSLRDLHFFDKHGEGLMESFNKVLPKLKFCEGVVNEFK